MLALRSLLAAHTGYVFLTLPVVVALGWAVSDLELPVRREKKRTFWDFWTWPRADAPESATMQLSALKVRC